ncbi:hypothetical protein OUZ56_008684 [Daphnia magna]|uniref:Uncharacterized protein n=1 Tax=Daphnia magna TaxID=35525 RepID=A0ABR0ADQ8_9CRUS|nr:hypothetical protein OUZ56_008684 [Daphnia magna]
MKLHSRFLILIQMIYSVFADLHHPKDEGLVLTTKFQLELYTDFSKFGFKRINHRGLEKALQPGISQFNPFAVFLRMCDSAGYGIINYSTRHARCLVFAPKKIYIRNSEFYSFSASPIASLDYLTTNRPTTAFMTHSAPAPVHMTPSYDAVISSRSADSQTSNYAATTPRTAATQAIPPK